MATSQQRERPAAGCEQRDIVASLEEELATEWHGLSFLPIWCGLAAVIWAVMIGFAFGVYLLVDALT